LIESTFFVQVQQASAHNRNETFIPIKKGVQVFCSTGVAFTPVHVLYPLCVVDRVVGQPESVAVDAPMTFREPIWQKTIVNSSFSVATREWAG
jgi:hypothetical protein